MGTASSVGSGQPPHAGQGCHVRSGWATQQGWIGWLLRVNRYYGPDEEWIKAASFARAFCGGCWLKAGNESKISRWETGLVRVPYLAVRRYEALLGLPSHTLVSIIDTIYRYWAPNVGGVPYLDRDHCAFDRNAVRRLEELLDRASSSTVMSGSDWDELTACVAATPALVLVPSLTWERITERLLAEMIIADRVPWLQRFEALNRLLVHPVGQAGAVAGCASLGADGTNQVPVETICALDGSSHPDASRHVLAQLASPTNDLAFFGALMACVRKVRYGHFTPPQMQRVAGAVSELLLEPIHRDRMRPLATELLRCMPGQVRKDHRMWLERAIAADRTLHQVITDGSLVRHDSAEPITSRIVASAVSGLPREIPGFHDDVFPLLITDMLFSPVFDVRLYTAMLIAATPYREPTARALAIELTPRVLGNTDLASSILDALRIVGGPNQRPLVERLTVAPWISAPVRSAAVHAIGHIGGESTNEYWKQAIDNHGAQRRQSRSRTSALALHGLVYALGIARNEQTLTALRDNIEISHPVRAAAAWWVNIPRYVQASARL